MMPLLSETAIIISCWPIRAVLPDTAMGEKKLSTTAKDQELLASTDDDGRIACMKTLFEQLYGGEAEKVSLAGGRVNLIGEHVDYPDVQFAGEPVVHLYSMGGAIQNNYIVAAAARSDSKIVLCHTLVGEVSPTGVFRVTRKWLPIKGMMMGIARVRQSFRPAWRRIRSPARPRRAA